MNSQWILFFFFVAAIILALDITRRAIFSIITMNKEQHQRELMRQLRRPKQPWVTVLIYGKNQAIELEQTVRKVRRSKYSNYDIVVVSDRSDDDSVQRIKGYISKVKAQPAIELLRRRATGTMTDAYKAAYRKSKRGQIIVCLKAGEDIDPLFIKRAVVMQDGKDEWKVKVEAATTKQGLMGIAGGLKALFFDASNYAPIYTQADFRRNKVVKPKSHNAEVLYGLEVVFVGAVILTIINTGLLTLWYIWILFSAYLLALVWVQFEATLSQKLKFSFSVPSALFLIPIVGLTEGIVQLRVRK